MAILAIIVGMMGARLAQLAYWPAPKYDLLLSIDLNDISYSDSRIAVVVRVDHRTAKVTFMAKPRDVATDLPQIFICEAKTGELHEIPVKLSRGMRTDRFPIFIDTPELTSLTIDDSRVAPDGYSPAGFEIGDVYLSSELLNSPSGYWPWDVILPLPIGRGLKRDNYTMCLKRFDSASNPAVHFIGWVIPSSAK